jgi:RNA polymerase sigma-70 factor, ECF subfamily
MAFMRDDEHMQCDVAREALSARIDGEREPVPAARVDEHLETCRECCAWYILADEQGKSLAFRAVEPRRDLSAHILITAGIEPLGRYHRWARWTRRYGVRWALLGVGVVQLALAVTQMGGADFGMLAGSAHQSGAMNGAHLMNETTAWSLALGLGMVVAGVWPAAAAGIVCVVGIFAVALAGYVVTDSMAGQVTAIRMLSHLPVIAGAVLAALVYCQFRATKHTPPAASGGESDGDIVLPGNASRGRRLGHLRSSTDSAA